MRAIHQHTQIELAPKLTTADTFFSRMKGLLGKKSLSSGEGLLIRPCKGVHTFGMKFPIDVIFLDRNNRVVATMRELPPNRVSRMYLQASAALELPSQTIESASVRVGDYVAIIS